MSPSPNETRWRRAVLAAVALAFCLPLAGCEFLVNEFTWLDVPPPPPLTAADSVAGP